MPKVFYCRQVKNGEQCGETNVENFSPGRYSACKACRSNLTSRLVSDKKVKDKNDRANYIDPDQNIRSLIEDTIKRIPFIEGRTIYDKIRDIDEMNTENVNSIGITNDNVSILIHRNKILEEKLYELTLEVQNLRELCSKRI
jgi:hypothetical protein